MQELYAEVDRLRAANERLRKELAKDRAVMSNHPAFFADAAAPTDAVGDGTPMTTFVLALKMAARRHPRRKHIKPSDERKVIARLGLAC